MVALGVGLRYIAVSCTAALLIAGCGGGDSGGSEPAADTSAPKPKKPQRADVEATLKAALGVSLFGVDVETVTCRPRGEDFVCRVRGATGGQAQPRSGRMTLDAQDGGGTVFIGSGKVQGPGGSSKISGLRIDLNRPAPAKPRASSLEDEIRLSLQQADLTLMITKLNCPQRKPAGRGAKFTCKARGLYANAEIPRFDIDVTQTDEAGKRFELSGEFDAKELTGGTRHGSFRNVKVVVSG